MVDQSSPQKLIFLTVLIGDGVLGLFGAFSTMNLAKEAIDKAWGQGLLSVENTPTLTFSEVTVDEFSPVKIDLIRKVR